MTALTRGTNLPQLGEFNQAAVLEAVRRGGGTLTRADLARMTGLSPQTVTNAVRRLIELGLVAEEAPQRRAGAGRPGTTLRIVADSRYAVGVHVDPAAVVVAVLDLAGEVVTTHVVPTPASESPDAVLDVVAEEIRSIAASAGVGRDRIVGVGVATPGPIDRERAVVLDPPNLTRWHDVPLRDEVAARTGLPTLLDKDVLAVASATLWYPSTGRPADAVVVYAGTGVALGVISGGEVVRGVSGNAGEAGHLSVGRPFGPCACGREGCLGGVLSTDAIVANAAARGIVLEPVPDGERSAITRVDAQVDALCELGRNQDAATLGLLADMGEALGSVLANVCDLLDLDTVVMSGPVWERLGFGIDPGLRRVLDAHAMPGRHGLRVLGAVGGVHAVAIGAGCLMLDDAFTPRATGLLLQG
jgi:predicted NBD/HSP70 family sugar kinase